MNIAIVVGLEEEMIAINQEIGIKVKTDKFIFPAVVGKIKKNNVLLLNCGPGKVNSALAALDIIIKYSPDLVIVCGLAGAAINKLKQGDVVLANKVIQHDAMAYNKGNFSPRMLKMYKNKQWQKIDYLPCDKHFVLLAKIIIRNISKEGSLNVGIMATGDQLILSKKYRQLIHRIYGAIAIDMESAAVGHVCSMFGVKFGCLKVVSDTDEISTNNKLSPSLIRDRSDDVMNNSQLCAKMLRRILTTK